MRSWALVCVCERVSECVRACSRVRTCVRAHQLEHLQRTTHSHPHSHACTHTQRHALQKHTHTHLILDTTQQPILPGRFRRKNLQDFAMFFVLALDLSYLHFGCFAELIKVFVRIIRLFLLGILGSFTFVSTTAARTALTF